MYSTANRCAPVGEVTASLRELRVLKVTSIEPSLSTGYPDKSSANFPHPLGVRSHKSPNNSNN